MEIVCVLYIWLTFITTSSAVSTMRDVALHCIWPMQICIFCLTIIPGLTVLLRLSRVIRSFPNNPGILNVAVLLSNCIFPLKYNVSNLRLVQLNVYQILRASRSFL